MSGAPIRWQDFDAGPDVTQGSAVQPARTAPDEATAMLLARAKGAARAEGFADGVAETESRIERELQHHIESLAAAVEAASVRADQRQQDTVAFIRTLISSLVRRIAPHIAEAELPHEVARVIAEILTDAPADGLVIDVAEKQHQPLADLLKAKGIQCTLRPVDNLTASRARIHWQGGFDQIDMNAAIDAVHVLILERLADDTAPPPVRHTSKDPNTSPDTSETQI